MKELPSQVPKDFFPHQTLISGTADKHIPCVVQLEKTEWLQSLSSGPAGISNWFSPSKIALLFGCLVRDHTSPENKSRYKLSTRGGKYES